MAGSAAEIKLLEYKDTITQLNTLLTAQTELNRSLQKTVEDLRQDNKNLMEQIDYLTKKLFGTSSEKSKDIEGQLCLFDEAEQAADPQETEESTAVTVPEHQRKARRTHEELFKGIPSRDEVLELPEAEQLCPVCGSRLEAIGKEFVRHEFRFTPAKGEVVNIYRTTYKCPECTEKEELADSPAFVKAEVPEADPEQLCITICSCMGHVSEVCQCNAPIPPGTGLEAAWCRFQAGSFSKLDHLLRTELLPSNV